MPLFSKPVPIVYNPGLLFLLVVFTSSALFFSSWLSTIPNVQTNSYVILYSTSAAVIGWIVGAYISTNNSRKQHTINLLLNYQHSAVFRKAAEEFQTAYPDDEKIKKDDLKNSSKKVGNEGARYLLNHMEFIAAGIKTRDLDHNLLYNTIRGQLCTIYTKSKVYIDDSRGADKEGSVKYPKMYEHIIALYEEWKNKKK